MAIRNWHRSICCHFPCGSVDWNWRGLSISTKILCHFPCGSVDWNSTGRKDRLLCWSSLPLRKCGLKFLLLWVISIWLTVTSLAEVWIEIFNIYSLRFGDLSLPLRKCGLKYLSNIFDDRNLLVTSLAEVWIEIPVLSHNDAASSRHFPCGSVDWNSTDFVDLWQHYGHFPCGSVDWNVKTLDYRESMWCHFPCGSVDWNTMMC